MDKPASNTTPRMCEWCEKRERPFVEGDGRRNKFAWVECRNCGSSGPARETKMEAVGAWNHAMRLIAEGKDREKKEAAA